MNIFWKYEDSVKKSDKKSWEYGENLRYKTTHPPHLVYGPPEPHPEGFQKVRFKRG